MKIPNGDEISQLLHGHCENKSSGKKYKEKDTGKKESLRGGGKILFSDANENSNGKHAERKQSKATPVACYYFCLFFFEAVYRNNIVKDEDDPFNSIV